MTSPARHTGALLGTPHDFDFLTGSWRVTHRRLRHRWVGSDDWDEFEGSSWCEPRLGGLANVDQVDCPSRGFSGLTLRVFEPSTSQWSIWWVNSSAGRLEPPVVGGFGGAAGPGTIGHFEGPDTDDDRPITVRFTWSVIDADRARWQQAFSSDGSTWETNWTMDFVRHEVEPGRR